MVYHLQINGQRLLESKVLFVIMHLITFIMYRLLNRTYSCSNEADATTLAGSHASRGWVFSRKNFQSKSRVCCPRMNRELKNTTTGPSGLMSVRLDNRYISATVHFSGYVLENENPTITMKPSPRRLRGYESCRFWFYFFSLSLCLSNYLLLARLWMFCTSLILYLRHESNSLPTFPQDYPRGSCSRAIFCTNTLWNPVSAIRYPYALTYTSTHAQSHVYMSIFLPLRARAW